MPLTSEIIKLLKEHDIVINAETRALVDDLVDAVSDISEAEDDESEDDEEG